jgi:hypothetical protein|tara:strand:- start:258 stop:434 length:177 start_codon:yes stop_codon:yes gene_type:complete
MSLSESFLAMLGLSLVSGVLLIILKHLGEWLFMKLMPRLLGEGRFAELLRSTDRDRGS